MQEYWTKCLRDMKAPYGRDAILRDRMYEYLPYIQYVMECRTYMMMVPRQSGKTHFIKSALNSIHDSYAVTANECLARDYKHDGFDKVTSIQTLGTNRWVGSRDVPFLNASCLFFDESIKNKDDLYQFLLKYTSLRQYQRGMPKDFFVMGFYT